MTLGLIADLYEPEDQQWPLAFIVLSSCIGTSIGGVIGGPIQYCELAALSSYYLGDSLVTNKNASLRPILALELLHSDHLWRLCAACTLFYARMSINHHYGPRSQTPPKRKHTGSLRTKRAEEASDFPERGGSDLAPPFRDVHPRAYRSVPVVALRFLRRHYLHLPGRLQSRI